MNRVAVVDYGVGNVTSIMNALDYCGYASVLTQDVATIENSDKIILPGVGAFSYCMQRLVDTGLDKVITSCVDSGKSLLGICVGMQVLFDESHEHGVHKGLGVFPGTVKKLPNNQISPERLPNIGWNHVGFCGSAKTQSVFSTLPSDDSYYFVHSYACEPVDQMDCVARSHYAGKEFTAAVARDNVLAVQFHPERSGPVGLEFLQQFIRA